MDKRSWPWKKKSSDKQAVEKAIASALDSSAAASDVKQDNDKPKYVQISSESFARLTGLEDQVKFYEEQVQTLEDEVKDLKEKLSEAHSEMTDQENLVKQHAKVAEEAVSGWEKAEAEAASLKNHLESVTLLKLTAEDRASHLDGALKECMRQIRNLKEEHDQNLHEVVLNKTRLFDKMKLELESRIANLDQELVRSAAENAALSRSLQDRSNILIQLNEEKSQAEAEIEHLKSNIGSCEKEINSLKYELHIARKEVEIHNEEKNMSMRSAEVAQKQHLEGVKKIAKLEAECQRLRGLVRKRLPGPAALAQMKLEVENLGRDYGESRLRRSPAKPSTPHMPQLSEFSLEKFQKENEILTERLLAMDEETKMLKEALAKRNGELQAAMDMYTQTASKLQSLEAQLQVNGEQKSLPISNSQVLCEGFSSQKASNLQSSTSMSEDGNDDNVSCAGSWATLSVSEVSYIKKEKNANPLDLMDDFLEMEKLAYQSHESNGTVLSSDVAGKTGDSGSELVNNEASVEAAMSTDPQSEGSHGVVEGPHSSCSLSNLQAVAEDANITSSDQELQTAISQIYDFLMVLGKEVQAVPGTFPGGDGLNRNLSVFSAKYTEAMNSKINPVDLVLDISHILHKASELHFNILGFKNLEVETGSSDCIDKIALPENKALVDSSGERYPNGCAHFSDSVSDPDIPNDGNLVPTSESASSWKCSLEEFEQLKTDKDNLAVDLSRCTEELESTKSQLLETEQILVDIKSQLASAQKSNSLAETQLKCMAESYNSLEKRTEELQTEVNLLRGKMESLDNELQEERRSHQGALARCKNLEEQLKRFDNSTASDNDVKTSQEELAAAAEKLAECQETIFLLGKQLKSLRPQADLGSPNSGRSQKIEASIEDEPTISGMLMQDIDPCETDTPTSFNLRRTGSESPLDMFNASSDSEANNPPRSPVQMQHPKHRPSKSGSSSASSTPTPEKHSRGFSRFFSSKGKSGH